MLKSSHKAFILLVLCVLCLKTTMRSQHDIGRYEFRWAFWHPFAALKVKRHLPKAMEVYKDVKQAKLLDTLEFGGKLDAFRHTFTMACLAQHIKVKKLRKLGMAHEKGNKRQFKKLKLEFGERADSLACEMDLRNNEAGFAIGSTHKKETMADLKLIVLTQIQAGKAWYLKRDRAYNYVTCEGRPIDMKAWAGVWGVPKCLIRTNEY
jgi:hypothetical protein